MTTAADRVSDDDDPAPGRVALGAELPLIVPVRQPEDLDRVGPAAAWFAGLYEAPIELVAIRGRDDDLNGDFEAFATRADALASETGTEVGLRLIVDDALPEEFFDVCVQGTVCMLTAASPFRDRHYVGSFAAALLARTPHPVLLLGPGATLPPQPFGGVTAAVAEDDVCGVEPAAEDIAARLGVPLHHVTIEASTGSVTTTTYPIDNDGLAERVEVELHTTPVRSSELADYLATEAGPTLLAIATHARQGLAWIADGSVAFDLIADAAAPVLVTGPKVGAIARSSSDLVSEERLLVELDATSAATACVELGRRAPAARERAGPGAVEYLYRARP